MGESKDENRLRLDLNNEVFQDNLLLLEKVESARVLNTLRKLRQMTWSQVYRDAGLKWEKIESVAAQPGVDSVHSLRVTQTRRATAHRQGDFMRFLMIQPDHDSTYGKK